jgi:RHH-type proline utilization regulon transcriptional repressor/proline dehydrogenase/delta 1-pyrroline-5-carboxylate dehydrogenase
VLGVMRARDLDHAIALQNQTPYGLTAGLFSLDEREIAQWCGAVQAGNLYVNRHVTGAIVQRQPFGGWKRSAIGPGAKAGGPNYVASLGTWRADQPHDPNRFASAAKQVWDEQFRHDTDATGLRAERNSFGYRPYTRGVVVRAAPGLDPAVIDSCRVAAGLATTPITVTSAVVGGDIDMVEDDDAFRARLATIAADKVRVLGYPDGTFGLAVLASGAAHDDVAFVADPRVELHRWVREQAISETRHRHGNLIVR